MSFQKAANSWTVAVLFAISAYSLFASDEVSPNGGEVSREQAIEVAKQELKKTAEDLARYEVYVDENNTVWHDRMALLRESLQKSAHEEFRKYDSVLQGKRYWTIFLVGKSVDGRYPKDDGFTAIVDKETGKILFFIPGG